MATKPLTYPPAMMPLDEAARYVGLTPRKFEREVALANIAGPFEVQGTRLWARKDLDAYVDALLGVASDSNWEARCKLFAGGRM